VCRGWGSSGFFQPETVALVVAMKQWGLGLIIKFTTFMDGQILIELETYEYVH
jgi:hypothetical protein